MGNIGYILGVTDVGISVDKQFFLLTLTIWEVMFDEY